MTAHVTPSSDFPVAECRHSFKVYFRQYAASPSKHYMEICTICGKQGRAFSHADFIALPEEIQTAAELISKEQIAALKTTYKTQYGAWHSPEYLDYINNSPKWQEKRRRVLERDGEICQACLNPNKKAVEAHHLTYEHLFNEPLFELVSVCRACHAKLHAEDFQN